MARRIISIVKMKLMHASKRPSATIYNIAHEDSLVSIAKLRTYYNFMFIKGITMHHILRVVVIGLFSAWMLVACAAEVGSDEWCADLKKNPHGDWSVDEVTNYAKYCLLK